MKLFIDHELLLTIILLKLNISTCHLVSERNAIYCLAKVMPSIGQRRDYDDTQLVDLNRRAPINFAFMSIAGKLVPLVSVVHRCIFETSPF